MNSIFNILRIKNLRGQPESSRDKFEYYFLFFTAPAVVSMLWVIATSGLYWLLKFGLIILLYLFVAFNFCPAFFYLRDKKLNRDEWNG